VLCFLVKGRGFFMFVELAEYAEYADNCTIHSDLSSDLSLGPARTTRNKNICNDPFWCAFLNCIYLMATKTVSHPSFAPVVTKDLRVVVFIATEVCDGLRGHSSGSLIRQRRRIGI
jgi:hypothetical protein